MPLPPSARRAAAHPSRLPSLLLLLLAACSDTVAPTDPLNVPTEEHTLGTLQVRAATDVVDAPASSGTAELRTTITLTNRGAWPLVLRVPACPLRVRGHRLASRADSAAFLYPGTPPFTSTGLLCATVLIEVTVAPGATHDLVATVDLRALRAVVPAGRWFLAAEVWIDVDTAPLLVRAGDVTL